MFVFCSYVTYIQNKNNAYYQKMYIKKFNYNFSGIVEDLKYVNAGNGIIYLQNDSIINRTYDPRDSLTYYCCIIKSHKSEIIVKTLDDYKKGDHVYINGDNNEILIFRNNSFLYKRDLTVSVFLLSAIEYRRYHKL